MKFARKCLAYKNTSDIFKKNTRKHKMKLRTREHFQVKHTRTVRLERSAVVSMTKQLNKHMKKKKKLANI